MGPRFFNRGNVWRRSRERGPSRPSMGPRFFNRGNSGAVLVMAFIPEPSMGPRFFNRGNYVLEFSVVPVGHPSMGPRFFNRGNCRDEQPESVRATAFNGAAVFQPRKSLASYPDGGRRLTIAFSRGRCRGAFSIDAALSLMMHLLSIVQFALASGPGAFPATGPLESQMETSDQTRLRLAGSLGYEHHSMT